MKIMELYTQRKISEKMMNTNMSAVIFFPGRQHYKCLSSPINTFLYLGSKMILYYFHDFHFSRRAVNLFLKGSDHGHFYQCV